MGRRLIAYAACTAEYIATLKALDKAAEEGKVVPARRSAFTGERQPAFARRVPIF